MKCEVSSLECKWSLGDTLQRGRAEVMFTDNNSAPLSLNASTHGPGWRMAHASHIDEKDLVV